MCVGGFRGHKSSNIIELSQFVQDIVFFSDLTFFGSGGVGQLGGAIWGDHLQCI